LDKELLNAIGLMMDEKLRPMQLDIAELKQEVAGVKQEVVKINIKIENEVTSRLNALMDGYILSHEKITDLDHRVEVIETRVS
jgi:hypothetical protein